MRLTNQEKRCVIQAIGFIYNEVTTYSCLALDKARSDFRWYRSDLSIKYCDFYGKSDHCNWFPFTIGNYWLHRRKNKEIRILLLLLFLEAHEDII